MNSCNALGSTFTNEFLDGIVGHNFAGVLSCFSDDASSPFADEELAEEPLVAGAFCCIASRFKDF